MKRYFVKRFVVASALVLMAGGALADPVEGLWKTAPDDNGNWGHIQVAPCAGKICGTLVKSFNPDGSVFDSPNIGKLIVWDMVPNGANRYNGGSIWDPSSDIIYSSKMSVSGDSLVVSGCVAGGLFCKKKNWTRLK